MEVVVLEPFCSAYQLAVEDCDWYDAFLVLEESYEYVNVRFGDDWVLAGFWTRGHHGQPEYYAQHDFA